MLTSQEQKRPLASRSSNYINNPSKNGLDFSQFRIAHRQVDSSHDAAESIHSQSVNARMQKLRPSIPRDTHNDRVNKLLPPQNANSRGVPGHLQKAAETKQKIKAECQNFNHHVMRPTHGCQVNSDTKLVYCAFSDLRIDNSLIQLERGGEPLDQVMGRLEELELPKYQVGAFTVRQKPRIDVPAQYRANLHYLENVIDNMVYPTNGNQAQLDTTCAETWKGTTLVVTRYEYANLYHALTDWWNAYFVMPPSSKTSTTAKSSFVSNFLRLNNNNRQTRVLFLDGHARGNLDTVWSHLFGQQQYVMQVAPGGLCLENAVFIPPGYLSPLFPIDKDERLRCPLRALADEFSDYVLEAYDLKSVKPIPGKVIIIDRQPYASHPRSKVDGFARVLTNVQELQYELQQHLHLATSVEVLRLENIPFNEQIRALRQAHVLVGNHGAGLSHVMFMDRQSHLVEFTTDYQEFFTYLSYWKGVPHTRIDIADETRLSSAEITQTITAIESIFSEMG